MSITVVIARDDVGAPTTREIYETGVKYSAEGGDLSILSAKPQLLATYGSGNWLSVYVDENVTVVSTKPDESEGSGFDDFSFDDDSSDDTSSDASESSSDDESSSE
jgi:hypothetical protein